ncbi:uncharacterized protein LOC143233762 isoform X2 [Tachypleus tridentatus]|uniref:uncharacterized protein LOC143233762 isoform X2 n=1 Tax=Tachypleus tridentatus TaxID=6853 RepID=UPI003FD5D0C1
MDFHTCARDEQSYCYTTSSHDSQVVETDGGQLILVLTEHNTSEGSIPIEPSSHTYTVLHVVEEDSRDVHTDSQSETVSVGVQAGEFQLSHCLKDLQPRRSALPMRLLNYDLLESIEDDNDELYSPKQSCGSRPKRKRKCDTVKRGMLVEKGDQSITKPALQNEHRAVTTRGKFVCRLCKEQFSSKKNLMSHQEAHLGGKPFVCEVCGKGFKSKDSRIRHQITHTGSKPYPCNLCDRSCSSAHALREHQAIHENRFLYNCEVCKRGFRQSSALWRHSLTHSSEKTYKCLVCNTFFTQSAYLRSHMLVHSGERPHLCEICKKTFAHLSDLNRHKLIHTNKRPYICQVCKADFADRSSCRRHQRGHVGKRSHLCQICGEAFKRTEHLTGHINKKHSCGDNASCRKRKTRQRPKSGKVKKNKQSEIPTLPNKETCFKNLITHPVVIASQSENQVNSVSDLVCPSVTLHQTENLVHNFPVENNVTDTVSSPITVSQTENLIQAVSVENTVTDLVPSSVTARQTENLVQAVPVQNNVMDLVPSSVTASQIENLVQAVPVQNNVMDLVPSSVTVSQTENLVQAVSVQNNVMDLVPSSVTASQTENLVHNMSVANNVSVSGSQNENLVYSIPARNQATELVHPSVTTQTRNLIHSIPVDKPVLGEVSSSVSISQTRDILEFNNEENDLVHPTLDLFNSISVTSQNKGYIQDINVTTNVIGEDNMSKIIEQSGSSSCSISEDKRETSSDAQSTHLVSCSLTDSFGKSSSKTTTDNQRTNFGSSLLGDFKGFTTSTSSGGTDYVLTGDLPVSTITQSLSSDFGGSSLVGSLRESTVHSEKVSHVNFCSLNNSYKYQTPTLRYTNEIMPQIVTRGGYYSQLRTSSSTKPDSFNPWEKEQGLPVDIVTTRMLNCYSENLSLQDLLSLSTQIDYISYPDFKSQDYYNWLSNFSTSCKLLTAPIDPELFSKISQVQKTISDVLCNPCGLLSRRHNFKMLMCISQDLQQVTNSHLKYILSQLNS